MNNFMTISRGAAVCAAVLALGVAGCGSSSDTAGSDLAGKIAVDGSSTVYPFAQAAVEQFNGDNPNVQITVGESGTGGGFEKFCAGETDISNASRPIDPEEVAICEKNGIKFTEVQVANDGIAIVTNPELKVECLTTDQLKEIWKDGSKVSELSSLASDLPGGELSLFGPGTDSGTFDYFTEEINGEKGNTRSDYQPSEDDNILVQGVSGDKGGLGYFGFSYYEANQDKLNLVAVDGGDGCVTASTETIQDGTYKPLSRPLFMYVKQDSLAKPDVSAFMTFTVDNNEAIATAAKTVPMSAEATTKSKQAIS